GAIRESGLHCNSRSQLTVVLYGYVSPTTSFSSSRKDAICHRNRIIQVFGDCDKLKRIPTFVPLVGNGQPFAYAPPSLTIRSSAEWWESLEWDDHPNLQKRGEKE
ncbi:hypothetical protein Gotur_033572, partial [Gossypium turneri]